MNDKELLQKIKENVSFWEYCATNTHYYELVLDDIEKIKWLIERVEQFEQLQAKVERYEEVLKFYADEETYETKFATDTDEIHDPFTLIELDEGKKARKALEEFSWNALSANQKQK